MERLVVYDKMHQTKLYELLRQYFQMNGCIQKLAEDNYVHRNTINNQLRKIEEILEVDFENWEDRLKIHLGLYAADIVR